MYYCDPMTQSQPVNWLSSYNNGYNSDRLESVLQNLSDHNVPEYFLSDYVQNWIECVCLKRDSNTFAEGVVCGIEQMLSQYCKVRCEQRFVDILEKIDVLILCGILEICFGINETRLINQVLLCTNESNPMVFNSYFDFTGRSSCDNYNEIKRDRLSYFLWHSSQARTLFDGHRLTERILLSLAKEDSNHISLDFPIKLEPKLLKTIISYGTYDLVATAKDFKCKSLCNFPIFHILRDILTDMYFLCYSSNGAMPSCILSRQPQSKDSIAALQLILRSIATIPKSFQENTSFWPDTRWGKYNFSVILQHFLSCDQLSELKYRLCQPAKLQHLCRIAIRKNLYKNWQLPDGISNLGLPDSLRHFVELKSD